jgi:AcrR family transcriptional regulator
MARQAERREATRSRILDAARELFAQSGFDGVSVAAIASRAGVVKGTVYQHFETKLDIALGLARRDQTTLPQIEARLARGAEPIDLLFRLLVGIAGWFEGQRPLVQPLVLHAMQRSDPGPYSVRLLVERLLAEAQHHGRVRTDVSARTLAPLMVGAVVPLFLAWAVDGRPGGLRRDVRRAVRIVLEGFRRGW